MIQIEHIRIEEFRGVREIDLDLHSKSFVVHGTNGSGKSGIVDAIDFALTGNVHRLSGVGTGGISVANHAPHVHSRETPENAVVKLTVRDVDSGQTAVLTRSVANPNTPTLEPDIPEVRTALSQAGAHPELTLSRRELINFVVSTAADRATGIQTLLQLDRLGIFRQRLQKARNDAKRIVTTAQTNLDISKQSLLTHVGGTSFTNELVLRVVNDRRLVLGAEELNAIDDQTDFLFGVSLAAGQSAVDIPTAITEVNALLTQLADSSVLDAKRDTLAEAIAKLNEDPALQNAIERQTLLTIGLAAVTGIECPLCGLEWADENSLKVHLQAEIDKATEARTLLQAVTMATSNYRSELVAFKAMVDHVVAPARMHGATGLAAKLESWSSAIAHHLGVLASEATVIAAAEQFSVRKYDAPDGVNGDVENLLVTLQAIPNLSASTNARDFLSVAKDRWGNVVGNRQVVDSATNEADLAAKVYEAYSLASDEALQMLYSTVEQDFSRYYRYINSDDEGSFSARFTPSDGSLDLAVDFYGIDMFPPNAYHSEGHQDGMGICLYLALMKQLLGSDFRLSILDDVVMSVDANHRRKFCELLKLEFSNVQFIITTHDEVWARQMQAAGLVSSQQHVRFYGWSVDGGPLYEQGDVWERIEEDLRHGDINGAAHKLRRRLEAATADIAESIGGRVAYRGDANYDLSEFVSAINGRHGDLLGKAAAAANSWNDDTAKEAVRVKQETRRIVLPEQQGESWAVNVLVHQNDWAQMTEQDFRPSLVASKQYLDLFACDNLECIGWIKVEGHPPSTLHCSCGAYSLNLNSK